MPGAGLTIGAALIYKDIYVGRSPRPEPVKPDITCDRLGVAGEKSLDQEVWPTICQSLANQMEPEEYRVWVEPLKPMVQDQGQLVLGCPNDFHRRWLRRHYEPRLRSLLTEVLPSATLRLDLLKPAEAKRQAPNRAHKHQPRLPRLALPPPRLNHRFKFQTFVKGRCNEFACAASHALADGQRMYANTLFLVSDTGLGKSHLTQAVGHYVLGRDDQTQVSYLTAEEFTSQMISALRAGRMEEFKDRFRRHCDLLLLEEVQFLAGKDKTQDELAFTLDALLDAGKRVIFTADRPPAQVKGIKNSLKSRLSYGVTAEIQPPDLATRKEILAQICSHEKASVDAEVLEYIAERVRGDIRRLYAALMGLLSQGSLTGRPLDLELAREVLKQAALTRRRLTPGQIGLSVAAAYGMPMDELASRSRRRAVTRPRNLAMYLCRQHTQASFASIGKVFNRDHATVMYGVNKIEAALNGDPRLSRELEYLEQRLGLDL